MSKFFATVPVGVWAGAVVILLGAWARDGWGIALGVILAVVTLITTSRKPEPEHVEEKDIDPEAEKDFWPESS
ncbi:MAG TPA: hypothetical protein VHZ06_07980 [Marmoricola sp.]|nr:hypothetical protein [Marmoricola sp.]